jgi:hypothetical protein
MQCNKSCDTPFLNTPLSDCNIFSEDGFAPVKGIAQAWVPMQPSGGEMYSACEGLRQGTIFPILDKPYECKLEGWCCDNG